VAVWCCCRLSEGFGIGNWWDWCGDDGGEGVGVEVNIGDI